MTPSLEAHYLATYDSYIYFSGEGSNAIMNIRSENTPWELSNLPSWLSANPNKGSTDQEVNLEAKENPMAFERVSIFNLESKDPKYIFSQDITANQSGSNAYLYLGSMGNTDRYYAPTVTGAAQVVGIPIFTNVNEIWWKKEYTYGLDITKLTFDSFDMEKGTINVEIPENTSNDVRKFELRISPYQNSSNSESRYLTITQNPADLKSIDNTNFNVSARATSVQFTFVSEVNWKASCDESWIQLSANSGNIGKETVTVDILKNESTASRHGSIVLKSEGGKTLQVIQIIQAGMQVTFSVNTLDFSESSSSQNVVLTSDMDWSLYSKPDWISIDPSSGSEGSTSISVTASANKSVSSRKGEISIVASSFIYTLKVTQRGLPFDLDQILVSMPWKASTSSVDLTCEGNWSAESSEPWLSVTPSTGSNSAKLSLSTLDNDSDTQRTGTVSVRSGDETRKIIVYQDAQIFNIEGTLGKFNVNGGSVEVTYYSNVSAKYLLTADPEEDAGTDWVVCTQETDPVDDGKTLNSFKFTALANKSSKPRAVYADMMPKEWGSTSDKTYRIRLEQPGRSISANVSRISFFYSGGNSESYQIFADGGYDISFNSDDHSWLTLDWDKDTNSFRVKATANTGKEIRTAALKLSLKNLPNGESSEVEIPIIQYPEGTVIEITPWGTDQDWSVGNGDNVIKINVSNWEEDKNWNI